MPKNTDVTIAMKVPRAERPMWDRVAAYRGHKNLHQFMQNVLRRHFNRALKEMGRSNEKDSAS
jgi:hypothetical protein